MPLTPPPTPPARSDSRNVFNQRASDYVTWLTNTFIPEVNAGLASAPTPWTLIASLTPSGVATTTFSSIPTTYSDLMIEIDQISFTTAVSAAPTLSVSADGVTFVGNGQIGNTANSNAAWAYSGSVFLPGYRRKAGVGLAGVIGGQPPGSALYDDQSQITEPFTWTLAAGISAVRFGWTGTNTFDAGTIRLYGR